MTPLPRMHTLLLELIRWVNRASSFTKAPNNTTWGRRARSDDSMHALISLLRGVHTKPPCEASSHWPFLSPVLRVGASCSGGMLSETGATGAHDTWGFSSGASDVKPLPQGRESHSDLHQTGIDPSRSADSSFAGRGPEWLSPPRQGECLPSVTIAGDVVCTCPAPSGD